MGRRGSSAAWARGTARDPPGIGLSKHGELRTANVRAGEPLCSPGHFPRSEPFRPGSAWLALSQAMARREEESSGSHKVVGGWDAPQ